MHGVVDAPVAGGVTPVVVGSAAPLLAGVMIGLIGGRRARRQASAMGDGESGMTFRMRWLARFVPAPPAAARRLTVTIGSFSDSLSPWQHADPMVEGPWAFEVSLADG